MMIDFAIEAGARRQGPRGKRSSRPALRFVHHDEQDAALLGAVPLGRSDSETDRVSPALGISIVGGLM